VALPNPFIEDQNVRRNFEELDARLAKFETSKGGLWTQSPGPGTPAVITIDQWDMYLLRIVVPVPAVLTGVRYRVGSTAAGSAYSHLYSPDGATLLRSDTGGTAQTGVNGFDSVPFDSTIEVGGGAYFAGLTFGDATATAWVDAFFQGAAVVADTDSTPPTTITPTTAATGGIPVMTLY